MNAPGAISVPSRSTSRSSTSTRGPLVLPGHQRHDRLPVEPEPVLLQGGGDPADPLHLALPDRHDGVVGLVEVHPVPAPLLGRVAGGVRVPEHRGEALALRR